MTGAGSTHTPDARFDRTIRALGQSGVNRLATTHLAVVGCGGLGSIMAEEFTRYGIGQLTLIDPDVVEESNLPRLFGAFPADVGRPKVEVVRDHLARIDENVRATTVQDRVENATPALREVDLIVAGLDRVSTRQWLNAYAVQHRTPYVDAGVIITTSGTEETETGTAPHIETMDGYIQVVLPGHSACFACLNRGDPERARIERLTEEEREEELARGYIDETQLSPEPAVVPLNGVVASKTVQLVAKLVTGYAEPPDYLHFEGVSNDLTTLSTTPRPDCPLCNPGTDQDLDLEADFDLTPAENDPDPETDQ
ncbi:HesA/MoeB/ThiF family protein [Halorarum salinum]|uniref:ThiF family adenylyltransferase n=1 Tax=Halorarum salinum TaxID=2743089 RepID=A0A7D5LA60_9EURY|nr:ThiF family adenylyltransferase [Halobaculum salinum]QLG61946.1 ThiF family adenylyltransferase [Halobaculum salinum]